MEDSLLGPYEVELPYDPKTALQEKWKHTSRQKQVSKWKKGRHKRSQILWFLLYEIFRIGKSIETKNKTKQNRLVLAKWWGK